MFYKIMFLGTCHMKYNAETDYPSPPNYLRTIPRINASEIKAHSEVSRLLGGAATVLGKVGSLLLKTLKCGEDTCVRGMLIEISLYADRTNPCYQAAER